MSDFADIAFEQLCFHDSRVESVERSGQSLTVRFSHAVVRHDSGHEVCRDVSLVFSEVEEERAVVWLDDKAGGEHPTPESPIAEVTESSRGGDEFKFEGFSREREWSEWWIRAGGFCLTILDPEL